MASGVRRLRCAVYTRKSTEEGLDKAFNSLDAQREACAAYVLSQQHEGWVLLPDIYDDGGFSGGSMERPALKQMLADIRAGRIDVVVVYKIDRLTRSLADFARIVDVLDAGNASFVSVTQAFSTTTSMGRLTLNVLLSFAQFEREVIAERIRDKVAASKARGMWMGGAVPLGYEVKDRKLVIVPAEAATVRLIMERYLEAANIASLVDELRRAGIVSKRRVMRSGEVRGGVPLQRGAVAWLLSNRVYVGEVVHKGTVYAGEHEAVVSRALFEAVQARLAERTAVPVNEGPRRRLSLLAGMIRDDRGRPMSPVHTRNHGRRYSYYASNRNDDQGAPAQRLPAGELEAGIRHRIADWLCNADTLRQLLPGGSLGDLHALRDVASRLAHDIADGSVAQARQSLSDMATSITVSPSRIETRIQPDAMLVMAGLAARGADALAIVIPTSIVHYGHEPRLRLEPSGHHPTPRDERLVELLARAFAARTQLLDMDEAALGALPTTQLRHLQRVAKLSYLDPGIVRAILGGTQPATLSARSLWRIAEFPLLWSAQRELLGFASR